MNLNIKCKNIMNKNYMYTTRRVLKVTYHSTGRASNRSPCRFVPSQSRCHPQGHILVPKILQSVWNCQVEFRPFPIPEVSLLLKLELYNVKIIANR